VVAAYFKLLPKHMPGETEQIHENPRLYRAFRLISEMDMRCSC